MRFGANCAYIILTTRKKSEFSADSNALISPKFRAGKIRAIREIRSQKIPLSGQDIAGPPGGEGVVKEVRYPKIRHWWLPSGNQ